jgi:hypothetical protein
VCVSLRSYVRSTFRPLECQNIAEEEEDDEGTLQLADNFFMNNMTELSTIFAILSPYEYSYTVGMSINDSSRCEKNILEI